MRDARAPRARQGRRDVSCANRRLPAPSQYRGSGGRARPIRERRGHFSGRWPECHAGYQSAHGQTTLRGRSAGDCGTKGHHDIPGFADRCHDPLCGNRRRSNHRARVCRAARRGPARGRSSSAQSRHHRRQLLLELYGVLPTGGHLGPRRDHAPAELARRYA